MAPPTISWVLSVSLLTILVMIPDSRSAPSYPFTLCSNTTMFEANSEYESHLNTVFNSLSSEATNPFGFSTASCGRDEVVVYGLFLCQGNMELSSCKDCVTTSVSDLNKTYCPRRKEAIIWYKECMVVYSNEYFFGQLDKYITAYISNTQNVNGNMTRFAEIMGEMMNRVAARGASNRGSRGGTFSEAYGEVFSSLRTHWDSLRWNWPTMTVLDAWPAVMVLAIGTLVFFIIITATTSIAYISAPPRVLRHKRVLPVTDGQRAESCQTGRPIYDKAEKGHFNNEPDQ